MASVTFQDKEIVYRRRDIRAVKEHHLRRDKVHHVEKRRVLNAEYIVLGVMMVLVGGYLFTVSIPLPDDILPSLQGLPKLVGGIILVMGLLVSAGVLLQRQRSILVEAGNTSLELPYDDETYHQLLRDMNGGDMEDTSSGSSSGSEEMIDSSED